MKFWFLATEIYLSKMRTRNKFKNTKSGKVHSRLQQNSPHIRSSRLRLHRLSWCSFTSLLPPQTPLNGYHVEKCHKYNFYIFIIYTYNLSGMAECFVRQHAAGKGGGGHRFCVSCKVQYVNHKAVQPRNLSADLSTRFRRNKVRSTGDATGLSIILSFKRYVWSYIHNS